MRSTARETANSTMLKPPMRRLRVREGVARLNNIASSFERVIRAPADQAGQEINMVQLRCQGQPDAAAAKHSTFGDETITFYSMRQGMGRNVTNRDRAVAG